MIIKRANIEEELFKIARRHQNRTIADMIYRSLAVSCRSSAMVELFTKQPRLSPTFKK